jgi:serine/threonine protein phosphatase PrpC
MTDTMDTLATHADIDPDDSTGWAGQAACISDIGQVRRNNEDSYRLGLADGIFIVADGMGGHQSGEIASCMVVDELPGILLKAEREAVERPVRYKSMLGRCVKMLNRLVNEKSTQEPALNGMGSTLAVVWFPDELGTIYLANVGDSRIYYFRRGVLNQLSQDHTMAAQLVLTGEISEEEERHHPGRNQLYRYIGMDGEAAAELHDMRIQKDDILLLCSDGLTDHLTDYRIINILNTYLDLEEACRALIDAANKQGGTDNLTVMLLRWKGR